MLFRNRIEIERINTCQRDFLQPDNPKVVLNGL